jgi:hypothetical protein
VFLDSSITKTKKEKTMKKKIAVIALLFSVASVGIASARGGMGYGRGYDQVPGYSYQQLDAATQAKLNIFYSENQDLRKQIVIKQAERQALAQANNPNPATVSKTSGELFDLMTTMQDKAKAAGLENYVGGSGRGRGIMNGGRGMMYGCRMM